MLLLLDSPRLFLAVGLALLVAIVAHGVVQAYAAAALGDRQPLALGRGNPDPRRHFEVFGIIAMLLAGIGWGRPVPLQEPRLPSARSRYALAVLAGPLTNLLLAFAAVVLLRLLAVTGARPELAGLPDLAGDGTRLFLVVFATVNASVGVLTLIPLPPLDGARLLWAYAPRTPGWQRARYHLEEQNIGLGLCMLLVLPIFGTDGMLVRIVAAVSDPLLDAMSALVGG